MSSKRVIRRARAQRDVEDAADHYFEEGGEALELRFLDALQVTVKRISEHPGVGSPRYAELLGIPGLRCWRLTQFPYLLFYIERELEIDLWRVLHERRDIPARFADAE